jgi:hypothetical protein
MDVAGYGRCPSREEWNSVSKGTDRCTIGHVLGFKHDEGLRCVIGRNGR